MADVVLKDGSGGNFTVDVSNKASAHNLTYVGGNAVTAGAGAVAAGTPRMTLASDDPAVASLGVMDDWDETNRCAVNLIASQAGVDGNSGTVSAKTQRVCLATDVALPAGTNLLGKVSASVETGTIYSGTTALTPKFAAIAASSSGANELVAAVTSKKIRVLAYSLSFAGTVNAKFRSDGSGTPVDLTGLKYGVANTHIERDFNPAGYFETASGKNLDLSLSGAVAVGGELTYIEV